MLWLILLLLLVLWLTGYSLDVAGGLIHVLLIIALVVLILQLVNVRGR